jgi:hypothetical protein
MTSLRGSTCRKAPRLTSLRKTISFYRHDDFVTAAARVTPSVSAEELRHYERLREQFSSLQAPSTKGNGNGDGKQQQEQQQLAKAAVRLPPSSLSKGQEDAGVMEEVWSSLGQGGGGGGKEEG